MRMNLGNRLSALRASGEIKTGRQFAGEQEKNRVMNIFPGQDREENTPFGKCYLREIVYPLDHEHGGSKLSGALFCHGSELALTARDAALTGFDPRSALFLDIETTGLAGGTGTWAFLIGVGWFDSRNFFLRQYFLRRPAEERAVLSHLALQAEKYPLMVSFNGKQFDLPLVNTRQMLAGFKPLEPLLHLDLLQCARALWRKRLASRSLKSLEESLFNLKREDDIPGAEIPAVYFNYLRKGETGLLKKVFHHNTLDILSMVTLLELIYNITSGKREKHPAESLVLGCLCLENGLDDKGIAYLVEASKSKSNDLAEEAALKLALHFKRRGKWEEALSIWEETVKNNKLNIEARVEMAKYYEHRCREFQVALSLTERALQVATTNHGLREIAENNNVLEALQHRRTRLLRRTGVLKTSQAIKRQTRSS